MITEPGYLPVKRGPSADAGGEIDMVRNFVLEEIAAGRPVATRNLFS